MLADAPVALRGLTGLTPDEFQSLLVDVATLYAIEEEPRLQRPGRQRAPGAGRRHLLAFADRVLLGVLAVRFQLNDFYLGLDFDVNTAMAGRVRRRLAGLIRQARLAPSILRKQGIVIRRAKEIEREVPELRTDFGALRGWVRFRSLQRLADVASVPSSCSSLSTTRCPRAAVVGEVAADRRRELCVSAPGAGAEKRSKQR
jgi:hypothetical protein